MRASHANGKDLAKEISLLKAQLEELTESMGGAGQSVVARGEEAVEALRAAVRLQPAMADAWQLPVAPHDCTGPVVWAASTQLSLHAPNALIQESVRAFYSGWYKELVTELPTVNQGMISLNNKPGLGLELLPDLHLRKDATVRVAKL